MPVKFSLIAILVVIASIGVAHATEANQASYKLSGFGTLGTTHSSLNLGDYVLDSTMKDGAGLSHDWATGIDSRIGIQLTADLTPKISAAFQTISEYQADGSYWPATEWANIKYVFTPNSHVRIGRIALPTFLNSDSRKVGYSYPWIHPPTDLYRQLAITNSDGVDAMYRFELHGAVNSISVMYGSNTLDRPTSISTSRYLRGIFDTLEYGAATLHIGYQMRESSSTSLVNGVVGNWTPNSDLSLGISYDPGNWFAMSEWIQRQSSSRSTAMYVSTGYRFDRFTPYLTYSQSSPATLLPDFAPFTPSQITLANRAQSTTSLGMRWDFMQSIDFKLQYDQVQLSDSSNGYLANLPANTTLYGTRFHLISAVVDFVF